MAVPSWKKRAEKRRPDLDDCVEQLQLLSHDKSKSIKSLGQLYVAAFGLVYHLRLDQKTIFSIRYVMRAETIMNTKFILGIRKLKFINVSRCISQFASSIMLSSIFSSSPYKINIQPIVSGTKTKTTTSDEGR